MPSSAGIGAVEGLDPVDDQAPAARPSTCADTWLLRVTSWSTNAPTTLRPGTTKFWKRSVCRVPSSVAKSIVTVASSGNGFMNTSSSRAPRAGDAPRERPRRARPWSCTVPWRDRRPPPSVVTWCSTATSPPSTSTIAAARGDVDEVAQRRPRCGCGPGRRRRRRGRVGRGRWWWSSRRCGGRGARSARVRWRAAGAATAPVSTVTTARRGSSVGLAISTTWSAKPVVGGGATGAVPGGRQRPRGVAAGIATPATTASDGGRRRRCESAASSTSPPAMTPPRMTRAVRREDLIGLLLGDEGSTAVGRRRGLGGPARAPAGGRAQGVVGSPGHRRLEPPAHEHPQHPEPGDGLDRHHAVAHERRAERGGWPRRPRRPRSRWPSRRASICVDRLAVDLELPADRSSTPTAARVLSPSSGPDQRRRPSSSGSTGGGAGQVEGERRRRPRRRWGPRPTTGARLASGGPPGCGTR